MGTIGVAEGVVWGARNSIVEHLVLFCISRAGPKDYLRNAKNMMDWGYNSFGVEGSDDGEFSEFLSIVKQYVTEDGFYIELSGSPDVKPYNLDYWEKESLVRLFRELIEKMERARPHLSSQGTGGDGSPRI